MDEFRILISGSRKWRDAHTIYRALGEYLGADNVTLISGHCDRGADVICEAFALEHDWKLELHPADWNLYGKRAGIIRNISMVAANPDIALVFLKDNSKGAGHLANLAHTTGVKTLVFNEFDIENYIDRCGDCPGCDAAAKGIVAESICTAWRLYDPACEWDVVLDQGGV